MGVVLACGSAVLGAGSGGAQPVQGPELDVPAASLRAALTCPPAAHPSRQTVLLVHGTAGDGPTHYGQGLAKTLSHEGFDWCMVNIPDREMGDIQTNAEYVVAAVRSISARTGKQVSVVGYSQGGPLIRWANRWWPDVRARTDRLITLEGANQGTLAGNFNCVLGKCAPALWQFQPGSAFIKALNRAPVPTGPVYTAIGSTSDELIRPLQTGENYFIPGNTGGNILIQDVCPGRIVTHGMAPFDAVAAAIVVRALSAPGHVRPAAIDKRVCGERFGVGVDPQAAPGAIAELYASGFTTTWTAPTMVDREPPLRPYARS